MRKNWFIVGAIIFLIFGLINTWLGITRYGIEQGFYFWLCNLFLFATAYGLWKKNPSWIIAFLSIAIFTQTFWIIDNIVRLVTKKNLFGLMEFMYQPGYPMDEFIVSHYHYFIIPVALFSLLFMDIKKSYAKILIIPVSTFIFGVSYFIFPSAQNINCIHESCFLPLNWKGEIYALTFFSLVTILGVVVAYIIEKIYKKIKITKKLKRNSTLALTAIIIISIILIIVDIIYKNTLPSFVCESSESQEIRISCKYTTDLSPGKMYLVYTIKSKISVAQICTSKIDMNGKEEIMHKDMYLEPKKKYDIEVILPYPKTDVKAKLSATCNYLSATPV